MPTADAVDLHHHVVGGVTTDHDLVTDHIELPPHGPTVEHDQAFGTEAVHRLRHLEQGDPGDRGLVRIVEFQPEP